MTDFHIALVPVGKIPGDELKAVASRVAKLWRQPVEVRDSVPVPRASEDAQRGQHRAVHLLGLLRTAALQLRPGVLVGSSDPNATLPARPNGLVFVTDVDLFTAATDGVFAALNSQHGLAVISVRRLREAFYRRPADAARQRSRLTKEVLRMAARLRGVAECVDPQCAVSPSKSIPDLDTKNEGFCRACAQRLFEGKIRV